MRLCPSGSQSLIATPSRSPGRPMQNPVKSLELCSICVSASDCDWRNPKPTPTMALPGRVVRTGPPLLDCSQSLGRFSETRVSGTPCQRGQSPSDGFFLLLFSGSLFPSKSYGLCRWSHIQQRPGSCDSGVTATQRILVPRLTRGKRFR